jgi:hypothetical protein
MTFCFIFFKTSKKQAENTYKEQKRWKIHGVTPFSAFQKMTSQIKAWVTPTEAGHGYNKGDTGDADARIWKIESPTDGYWVTPTEAGGMGTTRETLVMQMRNLEDLKSNRRVLGHVQAEHTRI